MCTAWEELPGKSFSLKTKRTHYTLVPRYSHDKYSAKKAPPANLPGGRGRRSAVMCEKLFYTVLHKAAHL